MKCKTNWSRLSLYARVALLGTLCLIAVCCVVWVLASSPGNSPWYIVGVLALGLLAIWVLAGIALRPIRRLSRQVDPENDNAPAPIAPPQSHDEVAVLVAAYNDLLQRIDAATDAQKRFAHTAALEMKTPVAAIQDSLNALRTEENPSSAAASETLASIQANTQRMAQLLDNMLALSATPQEQAYTSFAFSDMLRDIMTYLQPEADEAQVAIQLSGNTQLYGNRGQLERAFANILGNAIRFNHPGGRVYITGTGAGISIADTGIGIPDTLLQTVFDPFFCVDPSQSQRMGGSGLGLSVSKSILDAHGMRVSVASDAAGTTVTVFTKSIGGEDNAY